MLQSSLCPAPPRCWISKQIPSLLGRWALVWCFSGACSGSGAAEEPEHPFTPFLIPLSWELSRTAPWQHPGQGTAPPRHSGWSGSGFGTISPLQQNPSVELSCSFYSEKLPDGSVLFLLMGKLKIDNPSWSFLQPSEMASVAGQNSRFPKQQCIQASCIRARSFAWPLCHKSTAFPSSTELCPSQVHEFPPRKLKLPWKKKMLLVTF